jgi:hypothetical protein
VTGSNTISRPLLKTLNIPKKFTLCHAFVYLSKGGPSGGRQSTNPSVDTDVNSAFSEKINSVE